MNHPIQAETLKRRWSVHVRTCTDAPIDLSRPHIISVSVHVTNLSTISSAVPKIYRVSQNYPNMYFSTIISTALKPETTEDVDTKIL